jgi:hypothetical protein
MTWGSTNWGFFDHGWDSISLAFPMEERNLSINPWSPGSSATRMLGVLSGIPSDYLPKCRCDPPVAMGNLVSMDAFFVGKWSRNNGEIFHYRVVDGNGC